ncbi:DUF3618 domain-containing protein [Spirillospora sp. CA-142024]|uniref:DUF3618 domain-containing protein n=1 Tax=Spirillospora sp. CA-142024 TaxID=3240036 RepID=UPI003D90BDFC
MTTQGKHGAAAGTEELRQEVDRARHDLGETVEQLAAKADVKAIAREKAEYARGRARDAAASAWQAAGSEKTMTRARRGGAAIVAAGAVAAAAVWMRRSGTPRALPGRSRTSWALPGRGRTSWALPGRGRTLRARLGRGRNVPVRVRFSVGQKRAVKVRRRKMF